MTAAWLTVVGLAIGLGGNRAISELVSYTEVLGWIDDVVLRSDVKKWLGLVPMLVWVVAVEQAGFASLTGTRLVPQALVTTVAVGVVVMFVASAVVQYLTSLVGIGGIADGDTMPRLADRSITATVFTTVTAGVTEELIFRGFLIERLATLTGNDLVAGVVSVALFGAVHYGV